MLAAVIEEQGFGAALALVVARARPNRIDVAAVVFGLGMNRRVTINLAGRGLKNSGAEALGEPEHVDRAVHAGLRGLHRIVLIMVRGGGAGEIVDFVDFDVERKRHVVTYEFEPLVVEQRQDIVARAGEKIVDT
jgi:hypothetical protein